MEGHTHTHRIPHTIDYVELSVTDMQAARDFYGAAFGWTFTSYGDGYSGIRTSAESDGDEAGGLALTEGERAAEGAAVRSCCSSATTSMPHSPRSRRPAARS